jgi:hypothetical protein
MTRLLLLAAVSLCACALRDARNSNAPACTSSRQCDATYVCFLGQCRGGSINLAIVSAEVRPPNDSQLGQLQQAGIDLRKTVLQDFALQPPISVAGQVTQAQDVGAATPVAGASIVFTDRQPPIPDRVTRVMARSDVSGNYSARLPAGTWDVQVQPPDTQPPQHAPLSLPPSGGTGSAALNLTLPKASSLLRINGTLSSDAGPLSGARVSASDSSGTALSAPAVSVDGGFSLLLPAGTQQYYLHVGPPTDLDGGIPANDPLPNYDDLAPFSTDGGSPAVVLTLTAPATLQGRVVDATDAGIAGAHVYARTDNTPFWSLQRATTADATGAYSLALREGPYVVEAAPSSDPNTPGVSLEQLVQVSAASPPLNLQCPPKARAFGLVIKPDGSPAGAGFQITATRLPDRLLTTRTAWVGGGPIPGATDAAGLYHLIGDSGPYRVEVIPPVETGLPRKLVQFMLSQAGGAETVLPTIQISPPLEVVGTVHGAAPGALDAPVPGTTVDFFATDASGLTVFLGSGLTDSYGRYRAILPDVANPGVF